MEPISGIGTSKTADLAGSPKGARSDPFSRVFVLAKADKLLKPTAQYEKWTRIRQKNDDLAFRLGDILLQRHELLENAGQGRAIDWKRFDELTQKLGNHNIFLLSSEAFTNAKSLPGTGITPKATPEIQPSPDTLAVSPPAPGTPIRPAAPGDGPGRELISPDNLLILDAQYKNMLLSSGMTAYGDNNRVLIPLEEITRVIDFNIRVDAASQTAKGWFISEGRQFSLDLSKGEAVIEGRQLKIPEGKAGSADGEIYVDAQVLGEWFPVDFTYDFYNQSIKINPREDLPFQARAERESRLGQVIKGDRNNAVLPRKKSRYNLLEVPVMDISLQGAHESGKERDNGFSGEYSLLARGDVGKMTADIFFAGDDEDGLQNSRITLERGDPDGNILGPMKATHIAVGDVQVPDFPIISSGQNETGGTITNQALNRTRDFDTTRFEGDLPPGWDVELYRNGNLVGSQRVESDGRYDFKEVDLFYGKNDFELIFYGPQGQKRTQTKSMNVGNDMLRKGEGEYHLSVTTQNSTLVDPNPEFKTLDQDAVRMVGQYEYGINEQVSLSGGIQSQQLNKERHEYLNTGIKAAMGGVFAGADYVHDTQGGNAAQLFLQTGTETKAGPVDLRLSQQFYNNFTAENISGADPLKARTDISFSGVLENGEKFPDIPYTLSYRGSQKEQSSDNLLSLNLGANMGSTYLNNRLDWNDSPAWEESELEGQLRATGNFKNLRVRGALDYEVAPKLEIEGLELSTQFNPMDDLSTELLFKAELEAQDKVTGGVRLNWKNGKYILSPQVSYGSDGEFIASLAVTTSIGREPRSKKMYMTSEKSADTGRVSARVFYDRNNNAVFDQGDRPVEGAKVDAPQAFKQAQTNEDGVALLTGLKKYTPTDVVVDKNSLEDPFWEPSQTGNSIVPRPGHAELVEIPVIATSEIEGTVRLAKEDGDKSPLPNTRLQLVDENGDVADETRSEYDGFYLFMKVPPGRYSVRLHPDDSLRFTSRAEGLGEILIGSEGDVVSGRDLVLHKKAAEPEILAQKPVQSQAPPPVHVPVTLQVPPVQEKSLAGKDADTIAAAPAQPAQHVRQAMPQPKAEALSDSPDQPDTGQRYGVHLTSYRTPEKAVAGISFLKKQYPKLLSGCDYTVQKKDLGPEKGQWYRVVVSASGKRRMAEALRKRIRMHAPYCNVVPLEPKGDAGVHMTSFRTMEKAKLSIGELKTQYPSLLKDQPFSIRTVDLGPDKGVWQRVVAGRFQSNDEAQALAKKIKMQKPYTRMVPIEKKNDISIHLASFRQPERAEKALGEVNKKFGNLLGDEARYIRRVDLGPQKGIWYRVMVGRFEDRQAAGGLQNALAQKQQYARMISL
ncbi:MAG: SPOR domain-containing protein [Desulfobacterales bacterium]|nr:SPOR domain-containing protein [Desulfobacterales bacterium]